MRWEWDLPTVPGCWGGPAPMGAGFDYLKGPDWNSLHLLLGGHPFVLPGAAALAGASPRMRFTFANFFGTTWAFDPLPASGTHQLQGNITLTNNFTGCTITWASRVIFDQDMEFDYMKNFVDEIDVPTNTVLRWQYPYVPLPWQKGEGCDRMSIVWTDKPRPRPIYKLNSRPQSRYSPQSWRFLMP